MRKQHTEMKSLSALLVIVMLGIGATGCGGSGERAHPTAQASSTAAATSSRPTANATGTAATTPTASGSKDSNDGDSDPSGDDDSPILGFGHPASEADKGAITALVERYYAAAAANDGQGACSQIYLIFRESIPEAYGQSPGPPSLRGNTCAVVMSKLFKQHHSQLLADSTHLQVTSVRLEGKQGYALLRFRSEPRELQLHSELGVWRIDSLLDLPLP